MTTHFCWQTTSTNVTNIKHNQRCVIDQKNYSYISFNESVRKKSLIDILVIQFKKYFKESKRLLDKTNNELTKKTQKWQLMNQKDWRIFNQSKRFTILLMNLSKCLIIHHHNLIFNFSKQLRSFNESVKKLH